MCPRSIEGTPRFRTIQVYPNDLRVLPGHPEPGVAGRAGYVVIRITERLGGGEPLRTAYAVAEPNQHRAIALFKLRPDHTAHEQVEAVVELSQSALDSLGSSRERLSLSDGPSKCQVSPRL